MPPKSPAAVVFDCDGTLVDSEEIHAKALQGALAEVGVPLTIGQIRAQSVGIANGDYLRRVAGERGMTFPANAEQRVEDIAEGLIEHEIKLIEGADIVVRTLAARGFPLAVASNSRRRLVAQMLRAVGLAPLFGDRIAARDDVLHAKPAPDVYRYAAALLNARAEDCVAVEDSPVGVAAAHAAGMTVIGFGPPGVAITAEQLRHSGASAVITRLERLLSWLPP